ncbi:MAG: Ig-like domain-containing protein, partial [Planctomycetota bacterium]
MTTKHLRSARCRPCVLAGIAILSLVSIAVHAVDTDNDGLTDQDETERYLTDPAKPDTDEDGGSDLLEVLAGTDPKDSSSVFAFSHVDHQSSPTGNVVSLVFSTEPGKRYTIHRRSGLSTGTWEVVVADLLGTATNVVFVDTNLVEGAGCFYRVQTRANVSGLLTRDRWTGVSGNQIIDLTSFPAFPGSPDLSQTVTQIDTDDPGGNYGERIYGYLHPPVSGDYTFWISGRNVAEFWVSADDQASNAVMICQSPGADRYDWEANPTQRSTLIPLTAGQRYFIEVLQKANNQGSLDHHAAVAWATEGMSRRVIESPYLTHGAPLPPTVAADSYVVDEDQPLNVAPIGILRNDYDPDGDTLTALLVSGADSGQLTLNTNGSFIYLPNTNFAGSDSFVYKANDGAFDSANTATVNVTINPIDDAPLFIVNPITKADAMQDLPYTGQTLAGSATNVDAGDTLTYSQTGGPGWLIVHP